MIEEKAATLAQWLTEAKHVVVHTGAGVSTTAGECVCVCGNFHGDQTISNEPIHINFVESNPITASITVDHSDMMVLGWKHQSVA